MLKGTKTIVAILIATVMSCSVFAEINIDWSKPQPLNFSAERIHAIGDKFLLNKFDIAVAELRNDKLVILNQFNYPGNEKQWPTIQVVPNTNTVIAMSNDYPNTTGYHYYVGTFNNKTNTIKWSKSIKLDFSSYHSPIFTITDNGTVVLVFNKSDKNNHRFNYYNYGKFNGKTIDWKLKEPVMFSDKTQGDSGREIITLNNNEFVLVDSVDGNTYVRYGAIVSNGVLDWGYPIFMKLKSEFNSLCYVKPLSIIYTDNSGDEDQPSWHTFFKTEPNLNLIQHKCVNMNLPDGYEAEGVIYLEKQKRFLLLLYKDYDKTYYSLSENIDMYDF